MEVLWTAVSYAVFAGGLALAAYILMSWLRSGMH